MLLFGISSKKNSSTEREIENSHDCAKHTQGHREKEKEKRVHTKQKTQKKTLQNDSNIESHRFTTLEQVTRM